MRLNTQTTSFATIGEDDFLPDQEELTKLAGLLNQYAPYDGKFDLPFEGLHVIRATRTNPEATHLVSKPGMCIVAQGAKRVALGQEVYEYDESRLVVYSAEVPVRANIIKASKEEPYLCFVLDLSAQRLAELALKVFPRGVPKTPDTQAIYIGRSNLKIVTTAIRLMELVLQQEDADLLVPLVMDEILIRLLRSPAGAAIAQIGIADSHAHKIAKAITWLKAHYDEPIKVEELAGLAGMSPSSFHQHFKAITSMSPLQYQKTLRLQEARGLMLSQMHDVSTACMQVGYTSLSQFSREYSRFFGSSPSKDIARLHNQPPEQVV